MSDRPQPTSSSARHAWARSDKIASGALVVSILALVTSVWLFERADQSSHDVERRTHQTDIRVARSVVAGIGSRAQQLVESSKWLRFVADTALHLEQISPDTSSRTAPLWWSFLQHAELPSLSPSTEEISLLGRGDDSAAEDLAKCSFQRSEVATELKTFSGKWSPDMSSSVDYWVPRLTAKLDRLRDLCQVAAVSLTRVMAPSAPSTATAGKAHAASPVSPASLSAALSASSTTEPSRDKAEGKSIWDILTAVSTAAAAVATAVMAGFTLMAVKEGKTERAEANDHFAKTREQDQQHHQDSGRPLLVLAPSSPLDVIDRKNILENDLEIFQSKACIRCSIHNIGFGPAINVRLSIRQDGKTGFGPSREIIPIAASGSFDDGEGQIILPLKYGGSYNKADLENLPHGLWALVLEYEDLFGNVFHTIHNKHKQEPWTQTGRGPAPDIMQEIQSVILNPTGGPLEQATPPL